MAAVGLAGCLDEPLETVVIELRLEPGALDFGTVGLFASETREGNAINDGNTLLSLAEPPRIDGGDGAFSVDLETLELTTGGFASFAVTFTPTRSGPHDAVLVMTPIAPGEPVSMQLRGEGEPADVRFDPPALDFGEVWAGQSEDGAAAVHNDGATTTTVTFAFEGPGFRSDGRDRFAVTLGPGASETIPITFLPARGGVHEAALIAETCGPGCGPRVALTGLGKAPRIDVTPRPLELGEVSVGATVTETVTVTNTGAGALALSATGVLDGAGALTLEAVPVDGVTLEEGESVPLAVTFAPTGAAGAFQATLVFDSSDPLSPRVLVPVTATVPGRGLRVLPAAVHFGVLDEGDTKAADVVLLSTGTEPVTIQSLAVTGAGFSLITPASNLPLALAPQQSIIYTVEAAADLGLVTAGGSAGEVTVTADADDVTVPLTFAAGTEGCQARADPDNANIGYVRLGDGGHQSVVVENIGTEDCVLLSAGPRDGLPFDTGFTYDLDVDVLVPGQSGTVTFAFQASAPGAASAFLELVFDQTPAPVLVSSTAVAVSGSMVPEPPSLSFGPAQESCAGDSRVMNFVNDGAGPVTVESITLSPASANAEFALLWTKSLPYEVAPGEGFEVTVQPQANALGLFTGSVEVATVELGTITGAVSSEVVPAGQPVSESFTVGEAVNKVDVLFVVDNSGSMYDDQQLLADNFDSFIAAAETTDIDFHLGVTSTDVLSDGALKGALRGPPTVLDENTGDLAGTFADHVTLGVYGTALELGLEAMRLCLSEPLASTSNLGFHRTDAALSVVVVSDEDDSGPLASQVGFPQYDKSVDAYETFLLGLKGGVLTDTNVIFNAVVHPSASPRYLDLVDRFGGVALDISTATWGQQLSTIGAATFALPRSFTLENPAVMGSLQVTVDGVTTTDYVYDPQLNAVVLDDTPDEGAVIEVSYVPQCG